MTTGQFRGKPHHLWLISARAFGAALLFGLFSLPQPANACFYTEEGVCTTNMATDTWWGTQPPFSQNMQDYILDTIYRDKIVRNWWEQELRPALQAMTAQLSAATVQQAGAIGAMLDGQSANRAQLAMQVLGADAYKNYTPGENLCRFGTLTRSLAAADENATTTEIALASIGQARQLGTRGSSADTGMSQDRNARIDQFKRLYCDPADNGGKLGPICGGTSPISQPTRFNKDISINRTLLGKNTLDLDYTNGTLTPDEEDVVALASNLYGHDVLKRLTNLAVSGAAGNANAKLDYLNLRQLVAFRNVAQSSYNDAAARRTKGAKGASTYMINVLREMGMSDLEASRYLDNSTGEPSYDAQMEILTKKIYQNPNFYAGLIDKPANVDRSIASMQAFGLMQDHDINQSLSRQELLLSLLLEMKIRTEQRDVERNLGIVGLSK